MRLLRTVQQFIFQTEYGFLNFMKIQRTRIFSSSSFLEFGSKPSNFEEESALKWWLHFYSAAKRLSSGCKSGFKVFPIPQLVLLRTDWLKAGLWLNNHKWWVLYQFKTGLPLNGATHLLWPINIPKFKLQQSSRWNGKQSQVLCWRPGFDSHQRHCIGERTSNFQIINLPLQPNVVWKRNQTR